MYGTTRIRAQTGSRVDRAVLGPSLAVVYTGPLWVHGQITFEVHAGMAALGGVAMDAGFLVCGK
jgi:hypothetical protein